MVDASTPDFGRLGSIPGPRKPEAGGIDVDGLNQILPTSQPEVEVELQDASPASPSGPRALAWTRSASRVSWKSFWSEQSISNSLPPSRQVHEKHKAYMNELLQAWVAPLLIRTRPHGSHKPTARAVFYRWSATVSVAVSENRTCVSRVQRRKELNSSGCVLAFAGAGLNMTFDFMGPNPSCNPVSSFVMN